MSGACGSWEVSYEWAFQADFCHWVFEGLKSTPSIDSRCRLPQCQSDCNSSCFDTWVSVRCQSVRRFHRPAWLEIALHFDLKLSSIILVRARLLLTLTNGGGWYRVLYMESKWEFLLSTEAFSLEETRLAATGFSYPLSYLRSSYILDGAWENSFLCECLYS